VDTEPVGDLAPTAQQAFDAAYDAMLPHTRHAQIRAHVADQVVRALLERRAHAGMGHMLGLVYTSGKRLLFIDNALRDVDGPPEAINAAVKAAARVLAEG
jgi:hypothetical protein